MSLHFTKVFFLIAALLSHLHYSEGQQNQVSPKLDFDGGEDTTNSNNNNRNSTVPILPGGSGGGRGRSDSDSSNRERERDRDRDDEAGAGGGGGSKTGPKIHGVRVTVDTGDSHKSKESKESVEITDVGGKHKKRVGIHTDITFEITADGEVVDSNATSSAQKDDKDEDASVPIFKGRNHSSHKPRKPSSRWDPNFSTEHRGSGTGRGGTGPSYGSYPSYYPEYRGHNVPVYTGDSRHSSGGGSVYYRDDGWHNYKPSGQSQWTTERSYYEQGGWKPCYCLDSGREQRRRRHSSVNHDKVGVNIFKPVSPVLHVVDGKLDKPFSRK